jgi:hypothetical protein
MRAAPAVDYPLTRRGLWRQAGVVLASLAVFAPVGWAAWQLRTSHMIGESGILAWLLGGAVLASLAAAAHWRAAGRAPALRLRWDGACWQLLGASAEPEELRAPVVCVDLGAMLLLRAPRVMGRGPLYLPLERREHPAFWHALRVALAQAPASRAAGLGQPVPGVDA